MRIDAHQHFWIHHPQNHAWITDEMKALRRNFLPNDIAQTLKNNSIDGVVAVQAAQSLAETNFLIELSEVYKLIKGVVGWIDLQANNIAYEVEQFVHQPIVKGFRHLVESEEDPDFLLRTTFQNGLSALTKYGFTYDLLIHPRHYPATLACVASNPDQPFMLNHMAKPAIKTKEFDYWAEFIYNLSKYPNVYCKVSALDTKTDWKNWKLDYFNQYLEHVIACFGKNRVCFGSDWPVCLLAYSYEECMQIVQNKLGGFSELEVAAFWGGTASKFYKLS